MTTDSNIPEYNDGQRCRGILRVPMSGPAKRGVAPIPRFGGSVATHSKMARWPFPEAINFATCERKNMVGKTRNEKRESL
jgi:hypothetical protein